MTTTPEWLAKLGWTMTIDEVYDGPLVDPVDGEPVPGTNARVWTLTLRHGREIVRARWEVATHVLRLEPEPRWSAHFVGRVKRALIALSRDAADQRLNVPRLRNLPSPGLPSNLPSRVSTLPRCMTTLGKPVTSRPSSGE